MTEIKKVCFFSVGFAFNRYIRMKYYEKIFPKNVEMFLFTTDKYRGKEKENYQQKWDLKRTKIYYGVYGKLKTPFEFRKFCDKYSIDRVINIGNFFGGILLLIACIFRRRDYVLNILADIFDQYEVGDNLGYKFLYFIRLLALMPLAWFSRRTIFTDNIDSKRATIIFISPRRKMIHLAAPVNTDLFIPKDKKKVRKKLKLNINKKIVIFVGRIIYAKCSDVLRRVIESNPDLDFILIGRLIDSEFLKTKAKNFVHFENKSSKELIDFYNASDFSFCLNRGGGGIGLTTEEALACGVPVVVSEKFRLKGSKALFQVSVKFEEVDSVIKKFFNLNLKERKKLSEIARKYAEDNYSDKAWKEKYIENYLN